MKSHLLYEPQHENLVMTILRRTDSYIKASLILKRQYNVSLKLETDAEREIRLNKIGQNESVTIVAINSSKGQLSLF